MSTSKDNIKDYINDNTINDNNYHSMKGEEEDDDGRPKSASESLQINQLVGLLVHVKPEQMPDRSRFQSNLVREGGMSDEVCCPTIVFIFVLFQSEFTGGFAIFMYIFSLP